MTRRAAYELPVGPTLHAPEQPAPAQVLFCSHLTLQAALGWTNSHLFEIRARDVGQPSPDWPDGPLDARKGTPNPPTEATAS